MKAYRNAARTKNWIRQAFTELLAEKKDIEKITVTELVRRADISKATFYYHYDDIYAVAEEFENELIEQLSAAMAEFRRGSGGGEPDFDALTRGLIAFLKEHEDSYRMAMGASSPRLFVEKLKHIVTNMIAENAAALPFSPDEERRQVQICFVASACVDVVAEYFKGSFTADFDTVTEVILEAAEKLSREGAE